MLEAKAARGKRAKPGAAAFLANLEPEVLRLERELGSGSYRPGRYTVIEIRTPNTAWSRRRPSGTGWSTISAVVNPFSSAVSSTTARPPGQGNQPLRVTGSPVTAARIYRNPTDSQAAPSGTLWLAGRIIDGSNPQEAVNLYYPGDHLFFERRRGLPIGNLTSQFFANLYLNGLDHFCKEVLRAKGYLRYVDDFALFHDEREQIEVWRRRISEYLEGRRLRLHPRKTVVLDTTQPAPFLGLILLPDGYRRLPEDNVRRFRNRLRGLRDRWRAGTVERAEVIQRVRAWIAHAEHADTWRLRQAIFRAMRFGSARKPDRPANACCAAVPGTTNPKTSAPPTATGTPPANGTTTTVSVWPARSQAGTGAPKGAPGEPTSVQGRS